MAGQPPGSSQRPSADIQAQQTQPPQYYGYGWPPPEDEISLFDIWDALVRRRWLMVGVAAAVILLALAYALTRPDVYQYRQVLEIGSIQPADSLPVEAAEPRPIEPPERVAGALNDKILPEVVRVWRDRHPDDNWNPKITAEARKDAQIVVITSEASNQRSQDIKDVIQGATERVLKKHGEAVSILKEQMKIELQKQRRGLDSGRANSKAVRENLSRLDGRAEMLRQEISEMEEELENAQKRRDVLVKNAGGGVDSATYAVAKNEVQDIRARLSDLREELYVGISEQRTLEQEKLAEIENRVNEHQASIQAIQHRLETLPQTEALPEPKRSIHQVGTSGKLILALGIVLGGMLGILAAFVAEFAAAARRRHEATETESAT